MFFSTSWKFGNAEFFPSHFTHTRTHFTLHTATPVHISHTRHECHTCHMHRCHVTQLYSAKVATAGCPIIVTSARSQLGKIRKTVFRRRVCHTRRHTGVPCQIFVSICDLGSLEYLMTLYSVNWQLPASHNCQIGQMSIRQNSRTCKFSQPVKWFAVTSPQEGGYNKRDSFS